VLVIGAGGLGCELLKDLAMVGFSNIDVIDMDTIEYSNLNRQFLFRTGDVGKPKAEVAAAFINKRISGVNVVGHYAKIQDMPDTFYQQFHIIISGLDSIDARRWINETLVNLVVKDGEGEDWDEESIIPFIDGATEGLMGNIALYRPRRSACYECNTGSLASERNFANPCTIAATPRIPEHCIAFAMQMEWPKEKPEGLHIDGDDPEHISWIHDRALARAKSFGIAEFDQKFTQGFVKNIIPVCASTNAIISAGAANEAFKIATQCARSINNWLMYNGLEGVFTTNQTLEQNEECLVCSLQGVTLEFDPRYTLEQLRHYLITDTKKFKSLTEPSLVSRDSEGNQKYLYMTGFLSSVTSGNLPKPVGELIADGDVVLVTNLSTGKVTHTRNYILAVKHKADPHYPSLYGRLQHN